MRSANPKRSIFSVATMPYLALLTCLLASTTGCGSKAKPPSALAVSGAAVAGNIPGDTATFASLESGRGDTESLAGAIAALQGHVEAKVDLSFTSVTDDDLARIEFPDTVHEIDLSNTAITDQGVEHLMRARNLETLALNQTSVTEGVVEILKRMPRLCEVQLNNTNVSVPTQLELIRYLKPRDAARAEQISARHKRQ